MNAVLIPRFHFNPPQQPRLLFGEFFETYKSKILSGEKVDFYYKPTYWAFFKPFALLIGISGVLSILLEIKMYFLPTEGAQEFLEFAESAFGLITIYSLYFLLFFAMHRGKINRFNRSVRKMMLKTDTYEEFAKRYIRKYS